jgi:predicted RNA-binding Zn-ribbon protein involved in translation (DUF1610 family)
MMPSDRRTCDHVLEAVRSANGVHVYGWRCTRCTKQYAATPCAKCGVTGQHVARGEPKRDWLCPKCRRAEHEKGPKVVA